MAETTDDMKAGTIGLHSMMPAKGQIVELDVPASVERGAPLIIIGKVKNVANPGSETGTFKMQLLINGALHSTGPEFTLAPGETSPNKMPAGTAPTSGISMQYIVGCVRITG